MKLRTKLTLIMMVIGLTSSTLVGGIAYWLLMRDFRQSVQEQAFNHFQVDVKAYLTRYGSWSRAKASEPFHLFVQRTRRLPPPPDDEALGLPPAVGSRLPAGKFGPPPRGAADRAEGARIGSVPFLFMLTDPDGVVIKPGGAFSLGASVPRRLLADARPIEIDGKVAVLAIPLGEPNLTVQDQSYLAALQRALSLGIVGAALLALLLGLLFSRRVCGRLYELTAAIHAMRADGELEAEVIVHSQDEIGELAGAFNRMSCELSHAHSEMREAAIRDPLTQLHNRRYFNEQAALAFAQAQRYDQPLTVMIADLDHFKQINDQFSHAVGDEVLKRVGLILQRSIRKSDILARHGGEEFVILFSQTSLAQAYARCEALRCEIEAADWASVHPQLQVTMSIGLSDSRAEGSIEKMINIADEALYVAKRAGRNRIEPVAA